MGVAFLEVTENNNRASFGVLFASKIILAQMGLRVTNYGLDDYLGIACGPSSLVSALIKNHKNV